MAEALRFSPRRSGCQPAYRAYRCPFCGCWHTTKRDYYPDQMKRKHHLRRKGKIHD